MRVNPRLENLFLRYHGKYPFIAEKFDALVLEVITTGKRGMTKRGKKVSTCTIIETIRWKSYFTTRDDDGFKINQNFGPFYGRFFEYKYPQYRGFFKKKESCASNIDWSKLFWTAQDWENIIKHNGIEG